MTVEGYWRLYEGPLGCGKNAPRAAIWYLEVLRIVEPNPLPGNPNRNANGDGDARAGNHPDNNHDASGDGNRRRYADRRSPADRDTRGLPATAHDGNPRRLSVMHHVYALTRRVFRPSVHPPPDLSGGAKPIWLFFRGYRLLVDTTGERIRLPAARAPEELGLFPEHTQFLGWMDDAPCYAAEVTAGTNPPEGWSFAGLRSLLDVLETDLFWLAGRAVQIVDWDRTHQYCGRCATPTIYHTRDRARVCPECGLTQYPRLSPAIIVAVLRGDQILLARSHRHPPGRYSVLAGFRRAGRDS
jgi:hypothetical protein